MISRALAEKSEEGENIFVRFFPGMIIIAALLIYPAAFPVLAQDKGLEVLRFESPQKSFLGDSQITVVRIDPKYFSFHLLCASEHGKKRRTAKDWGLEFKLVGAINAGMFQQDSITSTGFMKNFSHVNNPKANPEYKSYLVFNPSAPSLPEIQLLDLQCDEVGALRANYNTIIQNLRMISCQGKNVWSQQKKKFSMASLGIDGKRNILFIFTRSPYSGNDFIKILLGLDIGIRRAMYLEGGPEASLWVKAGQTELSLFGSYETGFKEDDSNDSYWPITNVIGISSR